MNQQEMHDEQIKDKLRMKDDALKMAIEALEKIEMLPDDNNWYYIGTARIFCKKALEV